MSTWKARFAKRLKSPSRRMHPFPCSALLACFGKSRENAPCDQPIAPDTHSTIYDQPKIKACRHSSHLKGEEEKRRDSSTHLDRNGNANRNSSNHTAVQPAEISADMPGSPDGDLDGEVVTFQTSIPRPSVIEMPMVSIPNNVIEGMALEESSDNLVNAFSEQSCLTL